MNYKILDRRGALAGERFTFAERFQRTPPLQGEQQVFPNGGGNQGQWVCISCGVPLDNQFEKDTHCSGPKPKKNCMTTTIGPAAKHVLAWRSFVTGNVEVP